MVPVQAGDVISYLEMCAAEGQSLRRGMNFRTRSKNNILLMSRRVGAPYKDMVRENGRVLIYEGHDNPRPTSGMSPKEVDQELRSPDGRNTQNALFFDAARSFKTGRFPSPEKVKVYEKIKTGIWVYNGQFNLTDAWTEDSNGRNVFKFRLELVDNPNASTRENMNIDNTRIIPTDIKLEVWKRDGGRCVKCESKDNLHFDHIIPYSKGGTSLVASNIQILCARHNLEKRDNIE